MTPEKVRVNVCDYMTASLKDENEGMRLYTQRRCVECRTREQMSDLVMKTVQTWTLLCSNNGRCNFHTSEKKVLEHF